MLKLNQLSLINPTGPEVVAQAVRVLETIAKHSSLSLSLESHDFGGIAIDNHGNPLPDSTLQSCKEADAVLMGMYPVLLKRQGQHWLMS